MKLENLKRATEIYDEIRNLKKQIENSHDLLKKGSGFVISEDKDFSGNKIDYIFEKGNFPKSLYENIALCIVAELEIHLKKLNEEIESL